MILDLIQSLPAFDAVRVTAQYSNAVLVAILPYISETAQKLDLPTPHPITTQAVLNFSLPPNGRPEGQVILQDGWCFAFKKGHVETIQGPHSYLMLQDPNDIPRFFGPVRINTGEAVQLTRDALKKLGIPLESVFAEQEPQIDGPHIIGTNTVPYYRIRWPDPRGGFAVDVEVNGNARKIDRIKLSNDSLERPPPKVAVIPQPLLTSPEWPQMNPEYARQLIPIVLHALDDYAQKLSLPAPRPLTTNHIARFRIEDDDGSPSCEIDLTNGWRFLYGHSMVDGFEAPGRLFGPKRHPVLIKNLLGKWNMTEPEAKDLVVRTLAKLDYPTNNVHFEVKPQVVTPSVAGIPRYMFFWYYNVNDELQSTVWAEVDAETKQVKYLYYNDKHYWNQLPAIDAPLLLAAKPSATVPSPKRSTKQSDKTNSSGRLTFPLPLSR
jgi:hypothetical protein